MCDFIVTRMESYYVRRILDVANNRVSDPRSRYVMEAADVDKQQVHKVGRTVYTVPSASVAGATYTVDMDVGLCTCLVGRTGCGCKHQAAVAHMYKLATINQMPQFSSHLRRLLYCSTALLLYCSTALLLYCSTALLLYCSTALLLYCSTALLLYCSTALLHCNRKTSSCDAVFVRLVKRR